MAVHQDDESESIHYRQTILPSTMLMVGFESTDPVLMKVDWEEGGYFEPSEVEIFIRCWLIREGWSKHDIDQRIGVSQIPFMRFPKRVRYITRGRHYSDLVYHGPGYKD